jgi:hypothetical protein
MFKMNCCYSEYLTEVGVNLLQRHIQNVVRDTVLSHTYCTDIAYSVEYCSESCLLYIHSI